MADFDGIYIGGLWKNVGKDSGKTYLSGKLGFATLMIFPVKEKKGEKHPDYNMYVMPKREKEPEQEKENEMDDQIPF